MSHDVITYDEVMGRWEPNADHRLRTAALELFLERGFDETTVADVAERAGVTPRTFFRHYADKREVLFAGSDELVKTMVQALLAAPPDAGSLDAVDAALRAGAALIGRDRTWSRRRQQLLESHADLHGRELTKLAAIARALADGLRGRGVDSADAELAAETGIVVFRHGFAAWLAEPEERPLTEVMAESMRRVRSL